MIGGQEDYYHHTCIGGWGEGGIISARSTTNKCCWVGGYPPLYIYVSFTSILHVWVSKRGLPPFAYGWWETLYHSMRRKKLNHFINVLMEKT